MSEFIEKNSTNSIKDLITLVEIPTVTARGGENSKAILTELTRMFGNTGFEINIIETQGQPVFTAILDNKRTTTLLFYDHYDVQPEDPIKKWTSPPYKPEIREGKIFGRGVADNKGEIVTRLWAIKMMQDLGKEIPVNIKFVIEGEEEVSSPNLPDFVNDNRDLISADACIWEFGGTNAAGKQEIWAGVKGICYVQLKTETGTKDLHSALGAIIPNSANHLVAALASLRDDKTDRIMIDNYYDTVLEPTADQIEDISKIEIDEESLKSIWGIKGFIHESSGLELLKKYYFNPTCTICGIWSGWQGIGGKTVLPAIARAKIDFRLVPDQTPDTVIKLLKDHFDKNGFDIEIEWHEGYPPAYTPLNSPFVRIVKEVVSEVYNHEPVIHPWSPGSGPLYLFSDLMPVLSIGVGNKGSNAHSPDENINLGDFKQGQLCIARLLQRMPEINQ